METQTTKKWYTSKLVWAGALQVLITVLEFVGTLSPEIAGVATGINGILVIFFRALTSTAITK